MYLQLAENRSTWVNGYKRKANKVRGHNRYLNDAPPEYFLNEDGVYCREDCFDHLPLKEFSTMLAEQGFGLAGIKAAVQKRAARKEEKHELKVEKKKADIDKTYAKNDFKRSKGIAKETRAEKGTGGEIAKMAIQSLPQVLDTVGNVVGVVKGGEVIPVAPSSTPNYSNSGSSGVVDPSQTSWFDGTDNIPVFGNVQRKYSIPVGLVGLYLLNKKMKFV